MHRYVLTMISWVVLGIWMAGSLVRADESAQAVQCAADRDGGPRLPPAECNLRLEAPVSKWFEGIPLGNGQLGVLIGGQDNRLVVKVDRLDIWDERFLDFDSTNFTWTKLKESVEAKRAERKSDVPLEKVVIGHDKLFMGRGGPPTHLPIGQLLITLPKQAKATFFTLNLGGAEAGIEFEAGRPMTAIACATAPVILIRIPGKVEELELWAPGIEPAWPKKWMNPAPVLGQNETARWYEQLVGEGTNPGYSGSTHIPAWKFVVFTQQKVVGADTLIAVTVTSSQKDGADPLATARARTAQALTTGPGILWDAHRNHWARFWATSAVRIPDLPALRHYYISRYFLGASSSPGYPAMGALQSVWTDGQFPIPAFRNNLHNDLETQVQYQSYQTSGNFSEGRVFFEYLWERLPVWRGFAAKYCGTEGAAVPGAMSLAGNPTGGWPQYNLSPVYAGWFGWLFYQHWRYTQDREFLATRAYPWCVEIAECWSQLLKLDERGILKLPLSSASEIFNQSLRAWVKPNSNQDRDIMQAHLLGLAEMGDALGKTAEAARWREMAGKLGPQHVDQENALMYSEDEKVTEAHRHFSHLMSVWPFNTLTIEGSDRDRQIIVATMQKLDQHSQARGEGPVPYNNSWLGFSWPWMSSIRARTGDAESAYKYLDIFLRAFVARNGFHMNHDLHGIVRPAQPNPYLFTIEGNMMANQAVHDMLIQSWAPTLGKGESGIVRLFPATPWLWHEASFEDLRAEGGFRVSAKRMKNATVRFKIFAEADGLLRLRDNFGGREPKWIGLQMKRVGANFETMMRKGESVECALEPPQDIPPKPAQAYTGCKPLFAK